VLLLRRQRFRGARLLWRLCLRVGCRLISHYSIDWTAKTQGEDYHLGGFDFKRLHYKASLRFTVNEETQEDVEVGTMTCVKLNLHWIGNNGFEERDVLDEEGSWFEIRAALKKLRKDEATNAALIIERMTIAEEHRGHGLGLFLIEAADSVVNGGMSLCFVKPFPLQYEELGADQGLFPAAENKLRAYYARLGFDAAPDGSKWMVRWNGAVHPSLETAMSKEASAHVEAPSPVSPRSGSDDDDDDLEDFMQLVGNGVLPQPVYGGYGGNHNNMVDIPHALLNPQMFAQPVHGYANPGLAHGAPPPRMFSSLNPFLVAAEFGREIDSVVAATAGDAQRLHFAKTWEWERGNY
jgi:GNAT superfamily N-acetyltransferase